MTLTSQARLLQARLTLLLLAMVEHILGTPPGTWVPEAHPDARTWEETDE